jgi:hypothetical protein
MKFACIALASTLILCSISLAQTSRLSVTAYPASTLSGGINLRSVAGAPFSADVGSQTTQLMPDGTPVSRETRGKMFRDSAGRTRSETEVLSSAAGVEARRFVTIIDPVQGTSMVLDVAAKKATVFHLAAAPALAASKVNLAAVAQAGRASVRQLSPSGTEDLGGMMLEGFAVTGTRRANSSAASATKSTLPTDVTESWFSSELKVELLVTRQAPQSASRTTRLTNIAPGEPDPTVFQVPADYTVQEGGQAK